MATVIANAAISLDGFVADLHDDPGAIFDFWMNGPVELVGDPDRVFHVTAATAEFVGELWAGAGAEIIGRRLFDLINGWEGRSPAATDQVYVVTHEPPTDWDFPDAPFTFVDTLEAAVEQARQRAGDRYVLLTGGDLTGQALQLGLVDEIVVQLAPVILGSGRRFFGDYAGPAMLLDNPVVVEGDRVTHLRYRVQR